MSKTRNSFGLGKSPSLLSEDTYLNFEIEDYQPDANTEGIPVYRVSGIIPLSRLNNTHVRLFDLLHEIFTDKRKEA